MATQLQIRRGTTTENNVFTGATGELTMDTDTNGLRIHNGTTVGGVKIPTAQTADYVVEWQVPTDLNGYTWYRKYSSGWVEQGGSADLVATSGTVQTITLPIEMANNRYSVSATEHCDRSGTGGYSVGWRSKTTTSFALAGSSSGTNISNTWDWQVSGMAA